MKTLIIDSSHILYQLVFSMPELEHDLRQTHITFGFINKIISLANRFPTNRFIFCFDHKLNKRKKIYPQYKEKRNKKEKTPEEREMFRMAFEQLNELRETVLPSLGFRNIFQKAGVESDDIMASLVMNNEGDFVLVSNDEDMFQVLDYCSMYNSKTDKIYTRKDFFEEYGIEPRQWIGVKAGSGCTSDCVKGVEGVGVKTYIKYLNNELKPTSKKYQSIVSEEGKKIYEQNLPLVKLPYEGTGTFLIQEEKFRSVDFIEMCSGFNFSSILNGNGLKIWNGIFCESVLIK